jgi:hypothetical protein
VNTNLRTPAARQAAITLSVAAILPRSNASRGPHIFTWAAVWNTHSTPSSAAASASAACGKARSISTVGIPSFTKTAFGRRTTAVTR